MVKKAYINIQKNKLITPSILNCTEERQAYVICNGFDLGKACCPIFNSICKINSFSMNWMNFNLELSPHENMVKGMGFRIIEACICILALPCTNFETFGRSQNLCLPYMKNECSNYPLCYTSWGHELDMSSYAKA